jgi:hypothetical protein
MAFRRAILAVAAAAALAAVTVPPVQADGGVEAQVMAKIRAYHGGSLIQHSGLYGVARAHSMQMSREGRMSHDNADQRISNAQPDPFETNGAPDDGVPVAAWCENVTYSTGHPESEVAGRLFSQWEGSGAHARCMRDTKRNVGAVGVYYDGSTWWATFIATTDNTPPGGGTPAKTAAPKPAPVASAEPAAQPAPVATSAPAPQASGQPVSAANDVAQPQTSASPRTAADESENTDDTSLVPSIEVATDDEPLLGNAGTPFTPAESSTSLAYGWQELAAVGAVIFLASIIAGRKTRIRRKRLPPIVYEPPPPVTTHQAPERELVGAGVSAD